MQPTVRFYSDNTATICPEVLGAIVEANTGFAQSYGDDDWTRRLDAVLGDFFGTRVRAFSVTTGTAANALGIAALTTPFGAVFAHEQAHILRDECGAPAFFSGGAEVIPLTGVSGKLTAQLLADTLDENRASINAAQRSVVSLTQATEAGTAYRPHEISAVAHVAHARGLKVHMDGARLANALAFLNCHPAEVTWRAGIDVLTLGATKNGALGAEAVVFFDDSLTGDFELLRKRAGHLISKSRYLSAQLLAYIESGAWQRNAARANALARELGRCAGTLLLHQVEANEVFLKLGDDRKKLLRSEGFEFYDWGGSTSGEARAVVSWDQRKSDVAAFGAALERICP